MLTLEAINTRRNINGNANSYRPIIRPHHRSDQRTIQSAVTACTKKYIPEATYASTYEKHRYLSRTNKMTVETEGLISHDKVHQRPSEGHGIEQHGYSPQQGVQNKGQKKTLPIEFQAC